MRLRAKLWIGPMIALTVLGTAGVARADDGHGQERKTIKALDDCDPASFNQAIGPGTCVGHGDTTFPEFITQLQNLGRAPDWRFAPAREHVETGTGLLVKNRGGEAHTFTQVAHFGGGCVDVLNQILGLTPVPECTKDDLFNKTLVLPEQQLKVHALKPGVHRFQCLIHPWMHEVVVVRADDDHGDHDH